MSKKENLGNKANTNGFDKNPENINKKGRPRKSFSIINAELLQKGVEPLTKSQLIEAYSLIFNATKEDLKELAKDKNTPIAMKIIIAELKSKASRARALADYRDYMFGRASQTIGVKTKAKIEVQYVNVSKQFDDEGNPIKE